MDPIRCASCDRRRRRRVVGAIGAGVLLAGLALSGVMAVGAESEDDLTSPAAEDVTETTTPPDTTPATLPEPPPETTPPESPAPPPEGPVVRLGDDHQFRVRPLGDIRCRVSGTTLVPPVEAASSVPFSFGPWQSTRSARAARKILSGEPYVM